MGEVGSDLRAVDVLRKGREALVSELGKVIVGQTEVIDHILMALFCEGHSLIVGVPGLAKTLMVRTIARILDLEFRRIQFTPDLMPSDIIGTEFIQEDSATGRRELKFVKGPVFANVILADEINRTPPKTQAALLEAMEERRVTVAGTGYDLPAPFFVLATQNPIEQEGTYPLPEAQLDRFMFHIWIDYPSIPEECDIVRSTTAERKVELDRVLTAEQVKEIQRVVRRIPVSDAVIASAVKLVAATRPTHEGAPESVKKWVRWGAGPRASQYLILGAKARAVVRGELSVSESDIRAVAPAVLRHRIVVNFHAESEGVSSDEVVKQLLEVEA
ncbi:MAG: AAA family ATPase [Planctomycetota bacterium]